MRLRCTVVSLYIYYLYQIMVVVTRAIRPDIEPRLQHANIKRCRVVYSYNTELYYVYHCKWIFSFTSRFNNAPATVYSWRAVIFHSYRDYVFLLFYLQKIYNGAGCKFYKSFPLSLYLSPLIPFTLFFQIFAVIITYMRGTGRVSQTYFHIDFDIPIEIQMSWNICIRVDKYSRYILCT
jgi:hypothetical protein